MQEIINKILEQNKSIFGDNPNIDKINVGFTNTIYNVDDKYIIKICSKIDNEEKYTNKKDYENIIAYIEKYYPKLIHIDNLYKKLAAYDMIYYLRPYLNNPKYIEDKEAMLKAAKIVSHFFLA